MIEPPTEDEICEALSSLKVNKAGGKNGILPEMVKSCVGELMDYIVDHSELSGERSESLMNSGTFCWFRYRRETLHSVITGVESVSWV